MSYLCVDTNTPNDPAVFAPHNNLRVVEHHGIGPVPFDLMRVSLHVVAGQDRAVLSGHEVLVRLRGLPALNANFLDAWKALVWDAEKDELPKLFPSRFRQGEHGWHLYTFFWGTVYENAQGRRFVRYVCKVTDKPSFGLVCLDDRTFRVNSPAAVWTAP
jgi:hypothetical protein